MSAELLRRAAKVLRETAAEATTGTWNAYDDGLVWTNPPIPGDPVSGSSEWTDADYVALMHPPVALALADLLDKCVIAEDVDIPMAATDHALVALARAVLREEAS